jgi:hypothetical protein
MMNLDPAIIRQQIENLKIAYPALLEDDEAWLSALESETNMPELLTKVVRKIEDDRALSSGTGERLAELVERKARFEHRIKAGRELVFKLMSAAELAKLELPECTLSLRAGQPQLIGEADPQSLPDSFVRISRVVDRSAIKETLKAGGTVPGFELSNSPPSLTIRVT